MALPTVASAIDDRGEWVPDRECQCCGLKKVFRIQYGEKQSDSFLACTLCDRPRSER